MNEKKAKELTDSIFDKLNDQERVYLAWIHNQKNKEIQELKDIKKILEQFNGKTEEVKVKRVKEK